MATTVRARVRDGRLTLDVPYDAPDGTVVDLAVVDESDSLDKDDRARLHAALARGHDQAIAGGVIPAEAVLAKLLAGR